MKKIGLILVVFAFLINGASAEQSLGVGDSAPDFSIVDASGNKIRSGDFKGKKNVVLVFYAQHNWTPCREQLGELQDQISEIIKLNTELISIATKGDQNDVEMTKSSLGITFTQIPYPNTRIVLDFGMEYDYTGAAIGTIIIDKKGSIRFKSKASWTSASRIIKELQGIQWCDTNKVEIIRDR